MIVERIREGTSVVYMSKSCIVTGLIYIYVCMDNFMYKGGIYKGLKGPELNERHSGWDVCQITPVTRKEVIYRS